MTANLVAYPKDATANLTMYGQPTPMLEKKPVSHTIVMFVPGLAFEPPTPAQVAQAIWSYANRTLT